MSLWFPPSRRTSDPGTCQRVFLTADPYAKRGRSLSKALDRRSALSGNRPARLGLWCVTKQIKLEKFIRAKVFWRFRISLSEIKSDNGFAPFDSSWGGKWKRGQCPWHERQLVLRRLSLVEHLWGTCWGFQFLGWNFPKVIIENIWFRLLLGCLPALVLCYKCLLAKMVSLWGSRCLIFHLTTLDLSFQHVPANPWLIDLRWLATIGDIARNEGTNPIPYVATVQITIRKGKNESRSAREVSLFSKGTLGK